MIVTEPQARTAHGDSLEFQQMPVEARPPGNRAFCSLRRPVNGAYRPPGCSGFRLRFEFPRVFSILSCRPALFRKGARCPPHREIRVS